MKSETMKIGPEWEVKKWMVISLRAGFPFIQLFQLYSLCIWHDLSSVLYSVRGIYGFSSPQQSRLR
jgi:hypothetical protein